MLLDSLKERIVPDLLKRNAREYPHKLALVASSTQKGLCRITYAELNETTDRLANAIIKMGIRKGDKVAILLSNFDGFECLCTYYAIHKIGAINVPINTRYVGREIRYILNNSEAKLLVMGESFIDIIESIKNQLDQRPCFVIVGKNIPAWAHSFYEILESASGDALLESIKEEDTADIIYTSGTTGEPKGAVFTHWNCVATGMSLSLAMTLRESDIYQSAAPFFTSTGCHTNPLPVLAKSATYIFEPEFNVEKTLETIEREKTTAYLGVPAMFGFILDHPKFKNFNISSIRLLAFGGAVMPKITLEKIYEAFPNVEIVQLYGLTEGGPGGIRLPNKYARLKIGAVGVEGAGYTEFRVVDDYGKDIAPGETGELILRGPSIMKEYYKKPEETKEALRDGWLYTGDLVRMDEDRFLYHVDRKKDIIIRGGFNISSAEVEEILLHHPAVLEAAIVGKPHKSLGEEVKAFVVLKNGETVRPDEIINFCKTQLADYKIPREVVFLKALPRNALGKVQKTELRQAPLESNIK